MAHGGQHRFVLERPRTGLDGDVVIWDGDPLDVMSRALRVFVGGVDVYEWQPAADGRGGAGVVRRPYR